MTHKNSSLFLFQTNLTNSKKSVIKQDKNMGIITLGDFRQKLTRFKGNLKDFFLKMAECRASKSWAYFSRKSGEKFFPRECAVGSQTQILEHIRKNSSLFML